MQDRKKTRWIRIRIQAKKDSVLMLCVFILLMYHCSIKNHLNQVKKETYFLFSMVFVGSGAVSFDMDPDSGAQLLIRIRHIRFQFCNTAYSNDWIPSQINSRHRNNVYTSTDQFFSWEKCLHKYRLNVVKGPISTQVQQMNSCHGQCCGAVPFWPGLRLQLDKMAAPASAPAPAPATALAL